MFGVLVWELCRTLFSSAILKTGAGTDENHNGRQGFCSHIRTVISARFLQLLISANTNFCIINCKRQVEGELRHVVQIDVAVFRKGESKTL